MIRSPGNRMSPPESVWCAARRCRGGGAGEITSADLTNYGADKTGADSADFPGLRSLL